MFTNHRQSDRLADQSNKFRLPIAASIAALLLVACCVTDLRASCGDYVILTGQIPDWMQNDPALQRDMLHAQSRSAAQRDPIFDLIADTDRYRGHLSRLQQHTPRPPCHGPNCGSGQRQSMVPLQVPTVSDSESVDLHGIPAAVSFDDREAFARPTSDMPLIPAHLSRLDRPPQNV